MSCQTYAQQLARFAGAMTDGGAESLAADLDGDSSVNNVAMFVEGNLEKRIRILLIQLEATKEALAPDHPDGSDHLRDLIGRYVRSKQMALYELGDAIGFLRWLPSVQKLTVRQADHVAWNIARLSLEEQARSDPGGHARFQELIRLSSIAAEKLEQNSDVRIHLNPVRAFARLRTHALLGEDNQRPADVVLVASGDNIRTVVLDPYSRRSLQAFPGMKPTTFAQAAQRLVQIRRRDLPQFLRALAESGVIAFARKRA